MIYLDNAATTFPKPPETVREALRALRFYGANPGRSGHRLSLTAAKKVYECRERAAAMFGLGEPENAVFTRSCTEAVNIVVQSLLSEGGRCVISDLEHNSVYRPVWELARRGAAGLDIARVTEGEPEQTVRNFAALIGPETRLVVCTGASNVFGIKPPVREIAALCRQREVPFLLDAAQTAGAEDYHMEREGIDFLASPGHKGLMGPMGTGLLLARRPELLRPLIYGGTGSASLEAAQPDIMPDMLESGTLDLPGIAGLSGGLAWVRRQGAQRMALRENALAARLWDGLSRIRGVKLFTRRPTVEAYAPVVPFLLEGKTGEEAASLLDGRGVAARGGFQCAALAHGKMGTDITGVCRLSVGPFNTPAEIEQVIRIVRGLA